MVVTINTDASFNHQYGIGGYAYWIVYSGQRIKRGGVLKECKKPVEAEIKAIANALCRLITLDVTDIFFIVINTDCTHAIEIINGIRKSKVKGVNEAVEAINGYILELKLKNKVIKSNSDYVVFKHVKAHTKITDKRSYVNDWCDKVSKNFVKTHITKLCQQKNLHPGNG